MLYYCRLCGHRNPSTTEYCGRCGVRIEALQRDSIPAGWERAQIMKDLVERINESLERTRFMVEICTAQGKTYAYYTDSFLEEIWDSWYPTPPPKPSAEELQIRQLVVNQLHADGWQDSFGGHDVPTNSQFWRRSAEAAS